ncbi:MAG: hypothetical protein QM536_03950 [Chitinophagaceae bacterium]|nr:hypothetical protein [Chitinophagaceae bacterium]
MFTKKISTTTIYLLCVAIVSFTQCSTKKICSNYYTEYATASFYKPDGVNLDNISFDSVFTKADNQQKNIIPPTRRRYALYVFPLDTAITYFFCKNGHCDTLAFSYRYARRELISEECGATTEYILNSNVTTSFDSILIPYPALLLDTTKVNVKIFY